MCCSTKKQKHARLLIRIWPQRPAQCMLPAIQLGGLQGLAISMFLCAIAANTLYGGGILARTYDWESFWSSLPWLLGSLGTVGLDITIYIQVCGSCQPHQPSLLHAVQLPQPLGTRSVSCDSYS